MPDTVIQRLSQNARKSAKKEAFTFLASGPNGGVVIINSHTMTLKPKLPSWRSTSSVLASRREICKLFASSVEFFSSNCLSIRSYLLSMVNLLYILLIKSTGPYWCFPHRLISSLHSWPASKPVLSQYQYSHHTLPEKIPSSCLLKLFKPAVLRLLLLVHPTIT